MKHRFRLMCTLLLLAGAWPLAAQNLDAKQIAVTAERHDQNERQATPELIPNPLETLRNFEPARDEEYRIGPLLEVLARGGVEAGPNRSGQTPEVNQIPERCAIYRGSEQVVWVELRALMESGNAMADLRLRRDDVVYVPSISERFVSVLGEVQHPGAIPLAHNSTIASLLAQAGGLSDHAGNNAHIQIVDPASGRARVLTLKDVLDPAKSLEVTLKPGQIIYVPKSGFYRATYVLERLSPLITVASLAVYAGVL
jgi:polysaccharide biosynthesis/export protein